ncbi:MAG TPA: ATP-binding cassette domain-containing protein [Polyangiaceae bacterium]
MNQPGALEARIAARIGALELDVELRVPTGRLVLVGPNGAGKTSLLSLLLGVLRPARGRIAVAGRTLFDASSNIDVPPERRGLAYVPQDFALFPHLGVAENVRFPLACRDPRLERREQLERVATLLRELRITELADRDVRTLSGGERQRVALARALAAQPAALLLDEPLAALDIPARREMRDFLARYLGTLALPALIVSHDARDARLLGERIAVLESGRFTQVGAWDELRSCPASRFVEEFVASAAE